MSQTAKYKITRTFTGIRHRVLLEIHSGLRSAPEEVGAEYWFKSTRYYVSVLPSSAHRYTAFSRGTVVYNGDSWEVALQQVRHYAEHETPLVIPRAVTRFIEQEAAMRRVWPPFDHEVDLLSQERMRQEYADRVKASVQRGR